MPQSVTLTASMRSNLASLKTIQNQMDTTQTRLSTGKKVNSAIDNASSYYQSRSLTNRAADLDNLLDSMGQGIQTIQAANEGIESVTAFIEQAKSVANSAYALDPSADDYANQVASYTAQFNSIINEISTLAKDSSYQGINLLTGSKLTVMFNETRTHYLDVQGKKIVDDMAGLGFTTVDWDNGISGDETVTGSIANLADKKAALEDNATTGWASVSGITDSATLNSTIAAGAATDTYYSRKLDDNGVTYTYTSLGVGGTAPSPALEFDPDAEYFKLTTANIGSTLTDYNASRTAYINAVATTVANAASDINTTLTSVTKAIDYLRDYSSELGNNFAIIETRQNFTDNLVDVLETGSDNLVLADMNEESANYLALQTRQQLAINSLSLASQSAQSVLKLFS